MTRESVFVSDRFSLNCEMREKDTGRDRQTETETDK